MAKRRGQPDPRRTIFIDRNLGTGKVAGAIRAAGYPVEVHDAHFSQDTTDIELLAAIGQRKWVLISHDSNITRNVAELEALIYANIHAFFVRIANPSGATLAAAVVMALPCVYEIVSRALPPGFGFIGDDGKISEMQGYDRMVERVQEIRRRLPRQ